MEKLFKELESEIEAASVSFEDIQELEDVVTPGIGTGCNCY